MSIVRTCEVVMFDYISHNAMREIFEPATAVSGHNVHLKAVIQQLNGHECIMYEILRRHVGDIDEPEISSGAYGTRQHDLTCLRLGLLQSGPNTTGDSSYCHCLHAVCVLGLMI
jgi:hypothetical protein